MQTVAFFARGLSSSTSLAPVYSQCPLAEDDSLVYMYTSSRMPTSTIVPLSLASARTHARALTRIVLHPSLFRWHFMALYDCVHAYSITPAQLGSLGECTGTAFGCE